VSLQLPLLLTVIISTSFRHRGSNTALDSWWKEKARSTTHHLERHSLERCRMHGDYMARHLSQGNRHRRMERMDCL